MGVYSMTINSKKINIGIIGLGVVGKGVLNILKNNNDLITKGIEREIVIKKAAARSMESLEKSGLPKDILTQDPMEVVNDKDIDIIIELIGGYEPAGTLIETALKNGKSVITANKEVIAISGYELLKLANEKKVYLKFEASAVAGVPIVSSLYRSLTSYEIKKLIGVRVIGMTACPCAREVIKAIGKYKNIPPTHNQRNITTLMIEVPGEDNSVDANDLIDIVEKSFSSPTYGILKRKEEGMLVYNAHKNPKFVEDVVRDILSEILQKYKKLPDDVIVIVRSESEESIHKHNAFAERATTLGELRK